MRRKTMKSASPDAIDPKFFCVVAQLSHFAWGCLVISWAGILFPHSFWWILALWESLAAIKEFWYDHNYENPATRGSDLLDFSIYTLGALIGVSALFGKGFI